MNPRFIVVNDDPINNMLCSLTLSKFIDSTDIRCFQSSSEGLKFISSEYDEYHDRVSTILFLDINMPGIDGWEFLDEFAKMGEHIHKQFTIYMVSSSIDPSERERARDNIFVKDFLEKPLQPEIISNLLLEYSC